MSHKTIDMLDVSGCKSLMPFFSRLLLSRSTHRDAIGFMRLFAGITVLCFTFITTGFAQETGSISGSLVDSAGHQNLQGASIQLLSMPDFVMLVPQILSNEKARFELRAIPAGRYLLKINFVGYETVYKDVVLSATRLKIDLGDIYLRVRVEDLGGVMVVSPPLVAMKKDTVEYNAEVIASRGSDNLEDLVRKLPGIQIASDGTILANGQPIEQFYVDGKPFFGGDPAIALQNLPAEIVSKIQVYKAHSDQERFTGFSSGSGRQTLNIQIKKNMANGDFGKAGVGGGTGDTWAAGGNFNHFNGPKQLSLIGSANNINNTSSPTASSPFNDQTNVLSSGLLRTLNTGINYRDTRNSNTEAYGSYMYSTHHSTNEQENLIQNFFPGDSSTTSHQNAHSSVDGSSHNFSFKLTEKPDKLSSIIFNPGFVDQQSTNTNSQQSYLTGVLPQDTIYRSANQSKTSNDNRMLSSDLSFMRQLPKTSSSMVVGLKLTDRNNTVNTYSNTQTEYTTPVLYSSNLNKLIIQKVSTGAVSPSFSFIQNFGRQHALEFNYSYTWRPNQSSAYTYNYNGVDKKFDQIDSSQSNNYSYTYQTHMAAIDYRFEYAHWQIVTGLGLQADGLSQDNRVTDSVFKRQFKGLVPVLNLDYSVAGNRSFQLNYTGSFMELSMQQLQPVNTTTDSLFIQKGNPALKQPFQHVFSLAYRIWQAGSQQLLSFNLTGDITTNSIGNSVSQLSNGAQVFMPVNLSSEYNLSFNAIYGLQLKPLATNMTAGVTIGYMETPGLVNDQSTRTINMMGSLSLSSATTLKDKLDLTTNTALGYSAYQYTGGIQKPVNYFNMQTTVQTKYYFGRWALSASVTYKYNGSLPAGFQRGILQLSPALSRKIFKSRAGEIRFLVFDLLNQNNGIIRTVSSNTIQDSQSEVRKRYGMISFTYTFRHFPGLAKKQN